MILDVPNEILQVTRDCYLPLEDHHFFLITFKVGYINQCISAKLT